MSSKAYLHIDSSYRNRNTYPLASSFVVPISQNYNEYTPSAVYSSDPVSLAAPQYIFSGQSLVTAPTAFNGGTNTLPTLNVAASNLDNYYNGYNLVDVTIGQTRQILGYAGSSQTVTLDHPFSGTWASTDLYVLSDPSTASVVQFQPGGSLVSNAYAGKYLKDETLNQYRLITRYDGTTRTATLDSPYTGWAINNIYSVRGVPSEEQGLITGVTANTVTLAVTSSGENEHYTGKFMYFGSGALQGQTRIIVAYNGSTKVATLNQYFSVLPAIGNIYEILPFSYDNVYPLQYTGSVLSQQETTNYEIQLISLQLPNKLLVTSPGSRITYYPYVFVDIANDTAPSMSKNGIFSNNPSAQKAVFIVPITDVQDPDSAQFLSLTSDMVQTMRFKPNDNLRFSVSLPNGVLYNVGSDMYSPLPVDPTIQITAVFSIRRVQ